MRLFSNRCGCFKNESLFDEIDNDVGDVLAVVDPAVMPSFELEAEVRQHGRQTRGEVASVDVHALLDVDPAVEVARDFDAAQSALFAERQSEIPIAAGHESEPTERVFPHYN